MSLTTAEGLTTKTPALPFTIDGKRLQKRRDPPKVGQHTAEILDEIGVETSSGGNA